MHAYINATNPAQIDSVLLYLITTEIKGSAESTLSGSIDESERSEEDGCLQRVSREVI